MKTDTERLTSVADALRRIQQDTALLREVKDGWRQRAEEAEALAARLVAALRGIAQMPEIDEKDGHRLRALARLELEQIEEVGG